MPLFVLRRSALRGTYTILLACNRPFKLRIGKLGLVRLEKGYYFYTGSALGRGALSLEQRVARHRRRNKRVKWHIDYLTVHDEIVIVNVICTRNSRRLECKINRQILSNFDSEPVIRGAGASDCKCRGHLLSVKLLHARTMVKRLERIYAIYGKPLLL